MLGIPGFANLNRSTVRAEPNPLDKCTIVSIFPKVVHEIKPTIQPGVFHIAKGTYENPALLVVGPSSWWKELDLDQPLLEITNSSIQIADSIIRDYSNGVIGCDMAESQPGLFFLPGALTLQTIKEKHKDRLDIARTRQRNWYTGLIKMGDVLWARTNGNPLSISDDMRLAAQELGIKDKTWMKDFNTLELKNCPACGVLRNNDFPVCQHCKVVIDKKKFDELGLKFAS